MGCGEVVVLRVGSGVLLAAFSCSEVLSGVVEAPPLSCSPMQVVCPSAGQRPRAWARGERVPLCDGNILASGVETEFGLSSDLLWQTLPSLCRVFSS